MPGAQPGTTDTLLSSLSSTMDLLCPLSTIRRKNSSPAPWLSDVLRNNRRELRSAARKWKKSKLDTDLISYRTLLSKFSLDVTSAKTSFYKEKLETSAQDPRKLHNIFSSLLNPPAPPSPSSLTAEDFATFYTEKIERICQTFMYLPTSPTSHSQHSATPSLTQLSTVASEEVLQITRSCNPTTCLLDPIPSAMLQTISPDLLPFITTVINGSLMSGHVPTAFKKARVIPILKKPALDPSDISNYRPVSLLSFLSKILERVVCNQLSDYQNNLHDPNQSGFKAAHSTETALLAVTEKLHAARSAKLSSVLILLDLSAAFDTVNHKTLLSTLRSLGICGTAWEWFASYLDGRSYQLHNIFSSLLNPPAPPSPSSLTAEDFASFYTEKIERICQTFTFLPTSPTSHNQHSATPSLTQLSTVAAEEVLQITRSCNPTTCLLDPIPSAMLQTISPDLLPFITTVINGSLMSGHVPTAFKKARVIPILKKPALDPSDISNYRPVSLLSFLSKILERVVCNQLSDYLMQNNLHDPNQSGFKAAHSTETALLAVTEKLHAARSAKLSLVLILLDLSAAFDTVNHKTLLSTLRSLGICGTAWEWFASYLDGRSYQVTWKGLTSAPRRLSTGVPQGSVLGPLLFSLYTHSLGKVISSHGFSYHCYADDTQLIFSFPPSDTTASARISACLADISSWMTAHQLKLNPSKTELLIIPGDPSPAQDLAISLSNSMISPTASARNLGVTMDNQLSFSSHVTNVTRSCRFLLYNIRRIRPFLSTQATQVLVQSLVISRLDYCNSLLAGLPLNAIRPLQMIQNAAARLVFNLPKFFHTTPLLRSLHWLPVAARIIFKTLMLAYKAKNGPAPSYLKALVTSRTAPRLLRSTSQLDWSHHLSGKKPIQWDNHWCDGAPPEAEVFGSIRRAGDRGRAETESGTGTEFGNVKPIIPSV
ncbi:hypothetical protein QTP86_010741 [Hemibagrus guttatus]|nr:hypothetical protein QTP86_010741 [Hemibagrus guttatus]